MKYEPDTLNSTDWSDTQSVGIVHPFWSPCHPQYKEFITVLSSWELSTRKGNEQKKDLVETVTPHIGTILKDCKKTDDFIHYSLYVVKIVYCKWSLDVKDPLGFTYTHKRPFVSLRDLLVKHRTGIGESMNVSIARRRLYQNTILFFALLLSLFLCFSLHYLLHKIHLVNELIHRSTKTISKCNFVFCFVGVFSVLHYFISICKNLK